MKPDYKNWIPKGMLVSLIAGTVLSFALLLVFGVFGIGVSGKLRIALGVVFGIAFGFAALTALEGLAGHNTVGVQLIGTAGCLHPVLGRVVVAVLLGG